MTENSIVPAAPYAWLRSGWTLTFLLVVAFAALTAGDLLTTLAALKGGAAVELNPTAAKGGSGIRVGFLIASNTIVLAPLVTAFAFGIANAGRVPAAVLRHWYRHIVDIFYISPLNDGARARSPLRLVTAAMTLLNVKAVILLSNLLAVGGHMNPVSLLAAFWTRNGLTGSPRYWAAYLVLVIPCYVAGIGFAAAILRFVVNRRRSA